MFYYIITDELGVVMLTENGVRDDDLLWNNYNYFQTRRQAEEFAKRMKQELRKYHEELGE